MNPFTIEHIFTFLSGVYVGMVILAIVADIHTHRSPSIADKCALLGRVADQVLLEIEDEYRSNSEFQAIASPWPVNWADLTSWAAFVIGEDGDSFYRITIEEADPMATEFCQCVLSRIRERLDNTAFPNIEVETRW